MSSEPARKELNVSIENEPKGEPVSSVSDTPDNEVTITGGAAFGNTMPWDKAVASEEEGAPGNVIRIFQPSGDSEENANSAPAEIQVSPDVLETWPAGPVAQERRNPLDLPAHLEGLGLHLADLLQKTSGTKEDEEKGDKEYARLTAQLDHGDKEAVRDFVQYRLNVLADPAVQRQTKGEEYADKLDWQKRGKEIHEERERERSGAVDTWGRVDTKAARGEHRQGPEVGRFIENEVSNGGGVFYAGKVNTIFGPSESGKSMVALAVAAQELNAGRSVIMVDFEDDAQAVDRRLRDLGVMPDVIDELFIYIRPETGFGERQYAGLRRFIEERHEWENRVTTVIIDAATEAMTLDGLNGREENDVAKWQTSFPKRIASLGPAVLVVDHSPLDNGSREIGSQHKKSGVTGVSYRCDPVAQFGIGRKGRLRLYIAKDKIGSVRAASLPGKDWRGDLVIDGVGRPNNPDVSLWGVDPMKILEALAPAPEKTEAEKNGVRVPTEEEQRKVLAAITETPGLSGNALKTAVGGNRERAGLAIEWMERNGRIRVEKDGNRRAHYLPAPSEGAEETGGDAQGEP